MGPFIPGRTNPPAEPVSPRRQTYERLLRELQEAERDFNRLTRRPPRHPVHHYDGIHGSRIYCTCGWRTHRSLFLRQRMLNQFEDHLTIMGVN